MGEARHSRHPPLDYRAAQFITSAAQLAQCPPDEGREAAFAGRSNAGKSSALNALAGNRKLARASRTPGRTQLINFFGISPGRRLVDLPGYGYAKAPGAAQRAWMRELERYLAERRSLCGLVLLMDARHPLRPADCQLLDWTAAAGMPAHVLLTKADKLKKGAAANALQTARRRLAERWELATVQLFSARSISVPVPGAEGIRELSAVLDGWLAAPIEIEERG